MDPGSNTNAQRQKRWREKNKHSEQYKVKRQVIDKEYRNKKKLEDSPTEKLQKRLDATLRKQKSRQLAAQANLVRSIQPMVLGKAVNLLFDPLSSNEEHTTNDKIIKRNSICLPNMKRLANAQETPVISNSLDFLKQPTSSAYSSLTAQGGALKRVLIVRSIHKAAVPPKTGEDVTEDLKSGDNITDIPKNEHDELLTEFKPEMNDIEYDITEVTAKHTDTDVEIKVEIEESENFPTDITEGSDSSLMCIKDEITTPTEITEGSDSSSMCIKDEISTSTEIPEGSDSSSMSIKEEITTPTETTEGSDSSSMSFKEEITTPTETTEGSDSSSTSFKEEITTPTETTEGSDSSSMCIKDEITIDENDLETNKSDFYMDDLEYLGSETLEEETIEPHVNNRKRSSSGDIEEFHNNQVIKDLTQPNDAKTIDENPFSLYIEHRLTGLKSARIRMMCEHNIIKCLMIAEKEDASLSS